MPVKKTLEQAAMEGDDSATTKEPTRLKPPVQKKQSFEEQLTQLEATFQLDKVEESRLQPFFFAHGMIFFTRSIYILMKV